MLLKKQTCVLSVYNTIAAERERESEKERENREGGGVPRAPTRTLLFGEGMVMVNLTVQMLKFRSWNLYKRF